MAMRTLLGRPEGAGLNPSTTSIVGNVNPIHAHVSVQDHPYPGTSLQVVRTSVVTPQPLTVGQAGLPPGGGGVAATGHSVSRPAAMESGVGPAPYGPASYGREPFMPAGAGSAPYEPVANGPTVNGPAHGLNNSRAGGNRYPLPAGNASIAAAGPVNAPISARPGGVGWWTGGVPLLLIL